MSRVVIALSCAMAISGCAARHAPAAPAAPKRSAAERIAAVVALTGDAARGAERFERACSECHDATRDFRGVDAARVTDEVLHGNADMPSFDDQLSDGQIADLVAFLVR